MIARKVKSIFDKLIPRLAPLDTFLSRRLSPFQGLQKQDYILGSRHHQTKDWWTRLYCPGTKNTNNRIRNQFRKCRLNESEESPQNTCEEPIDVIFDHFDLNTPQASPEVQRSERKRKFTQPSTKMPRGRSIKSFTFLPFFQKKKKKTLRSVVLWDRSLTASLTLPVLYY